MDDITNEIRSKYDLHRNRKTELLLSERRRWQLRSIQRNDSLSIFINSISFIARSEQLMRLIAAAKNRRWSCEHSANLNLLAGIRWNQKWFGQFRWLISRLVALECADYFDKTRAISFFENTQLWFEEANREWMWQT